MAITDSYDFYKGGTGSTCTSCGEVFTDVLKHLEHIRDSHPVKRENVENLGVYTSRPNPDGSLTITRRHEGKKEEQTIKAGESAWGIKYYGVNPQCDEDEDDRSQFGAAFFP